MRSFPRASPVLTLLTVLAMALASPASAKDRPAKPPAADPLAKMLAEGWQVVADGVLQRPKGPTKVETFAFGAEGFAWAAARLEEKLAFFRAEQERYPSDDLARLVEEQEAELARLQVSVEKARSTGESGRAGLKAAVGCNFCYGGQADAYSLTNVRGVGASANANFSNGCGNSGNTLAYAYARTSTAAAVVQNVPKVGTSINSVAAATATGSTDCFSEAFAEVQSDALSYYYSISQTNSLCPVVATPPVPTISGPTALSLTGYECQTVTWTVATTGGVSPFSYQWKLNGTNVGTGTSYSRFFCGSNTSTTLSYTLRVDVTDSASQTAYDTHAFSLRTYRDFYQECGSGGVICP